MTQSTFEAFGFAEPLTRALEHCGYTTPTAIQTAALPPQIAGTDLLALAETGSGKTAAFVLPLLHEIASAPTNPETRHVYGLILAPTRELAIQIDGEVASLARNLPIRRAVVLGGVGKGPQIAALRRGVHILVATPGRLLDLVAERHVNLSTVKALVLDEADRMFDMGFIRDIRKIAGMIPRERRTALFSATMPAEIRTLAQEVLKNPQRVDLSPKQVVVDRIEQKVMIVRAADKQSRLHTLLKDETWSRVIVFTRTKRGADKVAQRLGMAGIGSVAIHGNKAQNARQRALADFAAGHVRVLVATDIAARGIDVSDVTHVVNFEIPTEPETYVHRIGRTARKGLSGVAFSLCDPAEKGDILAIERLMKQKVAVVDDVGGDVLPLPQRTPAQPRERDPRRDRRPSRNFTGRPDGGGRRDSGRPHGMDRNARSEPRDRDTSRDATARPNREPHREPRRDQKRDFNRDNRDAQASKHQRPSQPDAQHRSTKGEPHQNSPQGGHGKGHRPSRDNKPVHGSSTSAAPAPKPRSDHRGPSQKHGNQENAGWKGKAPKFFNRNKKPNQRHGEHPRRRSTDTPAA